MGYAFLKGLVSVYGPDQILVTDVNKSKREAAAKETGVCLLYTSYRRCGYFSTRLLCSTISARASGPAGF